MALVLRSNCERGQRERREVGVLVLDRDARKGNVADDFRARYRDQRDEIFIQPAQGIDEHSLIVSPESGRLDGVNRVDVGGGLHPDGYRPNAPLIS